MSVRKGAVDDAFGHWLAGFFDGEGSFGLYEDSRSGVWRAVAGINLRDDDEPILREIDERLGGIGAFHRQQKRNPDGSPFGRPLINWRIDGKEGCRQLVDVFDRYPLRAKKARDFAVWREGVLLVHSAPFQGRWERVAAVSARLRDGRAYDDETRARGATPFESNQLEFLERVA